MGNLSKEKLHSRRYDWNEILARKGKSVLRKGVDYNGESANFGIHFRQMAKKHGLRVKITSRSNHVEYEVVGKLSVKKGTKK